MKSETQEEGGRKTTQNKTFQAMCYESHQGREKMLSFLEQSTPVRLGVSKKETPASAGMARVEVGKPTV